MNLDPFGHIAVARHFQSDGRRRLSEAKLPQTKKLWADYIEAIDTRIRQMEKWEMDFWQSMHNESNDEASS